MAVPVVESSSFLAQGSVTTSFVVNKPSGVVEGDLLLSVFCTDSAGSTAHTQPSGFTEIFEDGSGGKTLSVAWKEAGGSEPSTYTFTSTSSEKGVVFLLRISGADTTTPVDVSGTSTATNSDLLAPSVTTTVDDCLVFYGFGADDDDLVAEDSGYPSGTTGVYTKKSNTGGGTACAGLAYKTQASAGSTGTGDYTDLAANEGHAEFTVAIAPAAGGGGGPTPIPPRLHNSDNQFATIIAHRLGGVLQ